MIVRVLIALKFYFALLLLEAVYVDLFEIYSKQRNMELNS
jgi:hypothetical protein